MKLFTMPLMIAAFFLSLCAQAETDVIRDITTNAEVRLLGPADNLLRSYLSDEWSCNFRNDGNVSIDVEVKYNGWTKLYVRKADVKISVFKSHLPHPIEIDTKCSVDVNDGGNQTIKYSCIKKLAKLIYSNIKLE